MFGIIGMGIVKTECSMKFGHSWAECGRLKKVAGHNAVGDALQRWGRIITHRFFTWMHEGDETVATILANF